MFIGLWVCQREIKDEAHEDFAKKHKKYLKFKFGIIFRHAFRMSHFKLHLICCDLFGSKNFK